MITTVATPDGPAEFVYVLSGIDSPYLVRMGDGSAKLLDAGDRYVADLGAPWAIDATGRYLPTSYELEGDVLTQKVGYGGAVFPVVADPSWTYSVDHRSYQVITGKEKASAARAMAELRRCFNCSFPVKGAPRAFPQEGQVIKLDASPISFVRYPAPVRVARVNSRSWSFVALPGHFDGAGSVVSFSLYNDASGWLHLAVAARVEEDGGDIPRAVNRKVAEETWLAFLSNLIRRRTL